MPVSHEHNIIFVHIPKTGGTSIEYILDMHKNNPNVGLSPYLKQKRDYCHLFGKGLQHLTLKEIENFFKACNFRDYSKFGRTKYAIDTWIKSNQWLGYIPKDNILNKVRQYYKFTIVRNPYDRLVSYFSWLNGKWHKKIELDRKEFKSFINKIYENEDYRRNRHLLSQHEFIFNTKHFTIDKIIRFENMNNEFAILSKDWDLNSELPKRMISLHKEFLHYYDDISKEKVYKMYQKDFDVFTYSK